MYVNMCNVIAFGWYKCKIKARSNDMLEATIKDAYEIWDLYFSIKSLKVSIWEDLILWATQ